MKKISLTDIFMIDFCGSLFLAEVLHLALMFLGGSLREFALMFAGGLLLLVAITILVCTLWNRHYKKASDVATAADTGRKEALPHVFLLSFVALVLTQMTVILFGNHIHIQGDMTVEMVASFMHTDDVYQVNPMTGMAYAQGMPLRLQVLGLPTLYGFVCALTGLAPEFVVWKLVPIVVLVFGYIAFGALAGAIFPEDKKKRNLFLLIAAILFYIEAGIGGMDGFGLLYGGWKGITIRSLILMPWLFSLMLRKKRLLALGVVAAEACICWTLYGMGWSVLIFVLMTAIDWGLTGKKRTPSRRVERRTGKHGTS